jgi:hypothetical protein
MRELSEILSTDFNLDIALSLLVALWPILSSHSKYMKLFA